MPVLTHTTTTFKSDCLFLRTKSSLNHLRSSVSQNPSPFPIRESLYKLQTGSEAHDYRLFSKINRFTLLDAYPLAKINVMVQAISNYRFFSTVDLKTGGRLYQFKRIPFGVTNGATCFQRVMDNILRVEKLKDFCLQRSLRNTINAYKDKCEFTKTQIKLLGYIIEQGTLKPDPERFKPLQVSLRRVLEMFAAYSQWIPRFSEKIPALARCTKYPLPQPVVDAFKALIKDILNSVVTAIDDELQFTVETDASDHAIAATLNLFGKPVSFFSKMLSNSEQRHSSGEKKACTVVDCITSAALSTV
ncbi:Retrovirus-related Pol polyprotein from transposon [Trichinella nativa]|uniref:Retrovirus-related Pol polyprotein from transposon n=1 Tax=Trichinella nativa TaxID=6335 RepID=A0A0V1LD33_9BILA|nr:Retrovirus-related Pol polyprotein from transposon [Trichinella nativa]